MKSKEKETSKTINKKNLEITKKKLLEKEFKKYLEEQLKHPKEWALSLAEAWIKKIDNLPFNLSDRIKNKSKSFQLSQNEEKKLYKVIAEFFIEELKVQEIERKIERELLKPPPELAKKKEKDLPSLKFDEVKTLRSIPINREFYEVIPLLIPYRLTGSSLIHKEILKDNSLVLKYKIQSRGKTIIFSFLVPPEILANTKEKDIPTVGVNVRRFLFGTLGFAFAGNTISPSFKKSHLLEFIGEDTQKRSKLYSDLEKGLLTWAYGTYTIISRDNKVLEVGHIINRLQLPKKRGDSIIVEFNPRVVKPLFRSEMDSQTLTYIDYPVDLLKVKPKEMKSYLRNFCESLLKKKGMGREVYPKYVKNILVHDFGIPSNKLRKLSNKQIHNIFIEGANEAKHRGLLEGYTATVKSQKKAPYNMRKWKIKLLVPSKPKDDPYQT